MGNGNMADLSITSANVGVNDANVRTATIQAGEAITRGEPVYRDSTASNKAKSAIATATASASVYGIAITEASADGDYIVVQTAGKIITGASGLTQGQMYYLSDTAGGGKICPFADLDSGDYVVGIYRATSATEANMVLENSGLTIA